ncbi:hypothetical protein BASA60_008806 [Batrachochytrium salamandrivorans]|nr:hypothetical protein BASA60_008806 [Batrachochytrium salamandrivorans]
MSSVIQSVPGTRVLSQSSTAMQMNIVSPVAAVAAEAATAASFHASTTTGTTGTTATVQSACSPRTSRKRGRQDGQVRLIPTHLSCLNGSTVLAITTDSPTNTTTNTTNTTNTTGSAVTTPVTTIPSAFEFRTADTFNDMDVVDVDEMYVPAGMDIDKDALITHRHIYSLTQQQLSAARSLAHSRLSKALFIDIVISPDLTTDHDPDMLSRSSVPTNSTTTTAESRLAHSATSLRRASYCLPLSQAHSFSMRKTRARSASQSQSQIQTQLRSRPSQTRRDCTGHTLSISDGTTHIFVTENFPIPAFMFYCCRFVLKEAHALGARSASVVRAFEKSPAIFQSGPIATDHTIMENSVNKTGLLAFLDQLESTAPPTHPPSLLQTVLTRTRSAVASAHIVNLEIVVRLLYAHCATQAHLVPKHLESVFQGILAINQATGTANPRRDSCIRIPSHATRRLLRDALLLIPSPERNLLQFISLFGSVQSTSATMTPEETFKSRSVYTLSHPLDNSNLLPAISAYFSPWISDTLSGNPTTTPRSARKGSGSNSGNPSFSGVPQSTPWACALIELLIICDSMTDTSVMLWSLPKSLVNEIRSLMLTWRSQKTGFPGSGGLTPRRVNRNIYSRGHLSSAKRRLFKGKTVSNSGSSCGIGSGGCGSTMMAATKLGGSSLAIVNEQSPFVDTTIPDMSDTDGEQRNKKRRRLQ